MARIRVVTPENAQGLKRLLYWYLLRQTQGYVGGIAKILLTDPQRAFPMLRLYAPSYVITAFTPPTRDDRVPLGCADSGYTAVQYSKKGIRM